MKKILTLSSFLLFLTTTYQASALPACGHCGPKGQQIPCDENKTLGNGWPAPHECWDACGCAPGRFCCPSANNQTWICQSARIGPDAGQCLPKSR